MAAQDLNYLDRAMRRIAGEIAVGAVEVVREVVLNMGPALGYSTPIDTGRARANWQAAVNTQPTNILYAEPSQPPSPASGAQMAINSLTAAAMAYRQEQTVYVVNNVPYINRLNAGSSTQAPAGFVQIAVHVAIRTIRNRRWVR